MLTRDNMFDLESWPVESFWNMAVFTYSMRTFADESREGSIHAGLLRATTRSLLQEFSRSRFQNGEHCANAFVVVDFEFLGGSQ